MVSSNSSNELKHNFPHHQQKLNVSLNLCHEEDTKTIDYYFADNKPDRGMILNPVQFFRKKKLMMNYST